MVVEIVFGVNWDVVLEDVDRVFRLLVSGSTCHVIVNRLVNHKA